VKGLKRSAAFGTKKKKEKKEKVREERGGEMGVE